MLTAHMKTDSVHMKDSSVTCPSPQTQARMAMIASDALNAHGESQCNLLTSH